VRPFRFGFQSTSTDPEEVARSARLAEDTGFDIFQVGDHVGAEPSALLSLATAAMVTDQIRLGTLVLNNDLRHPVTLAQELATLDHLSTGRLEVGMGAGHSFTEYAAIGMPFDSPAVRKERLAEAVEIVRALLDTGSITFAGNHYNLDGAATLPALQAHVPLLVGVNGRAALAHAAQHADTIAPTMLGRPLADGHQHAVRWEASRLDETIDCMRECAGSRWSSIEIHALVQSVAVTQDRAHTASDIATRTGMHPSDILCTPFQCLGSHEEMAQHLLMCRERWGISYYSVRDIEAFAPVIRLLRSSSIG